MTADAVRSALSEFGQVYDCLTPFERKELIRLVLRRAEVGDRQIVLELYGTLTPEMTARIARCYRCAKDIQAALQPSFGFRAFLRVGAEEIHLLP